jgi:uncharacterized protein
VDVGILIAAATVMAAAAALQSAVGFGGNLVAAPILALMDPGLVPVPILIGSTAINLAMVAREPGHSGWGPFSWILAGRLPGSFVGLALLAALQPAGIQLVLGLGLLVAVAATWQRWVIPRTAGGLLGAGLLSGAGATAVGVGGPPVALVFQHSTGPELRGTLARTLLAGQVMSLAVLAVGGRIGGLELRQGLALVPGVLVGLLGGPALAARLDQGRTRGAVLVVCAASAAVLLVEALR